MEQNRTREERIDELLDRQAILDLVHAYCNAADRHDVDKMRQLYHDDAIDDHGHFSKGPAQEFLDRLPQIQASMRILHHNVTTTNIRIDGDYAEGEIYIIAFHQVQEADRRFDLLVGGRYFDKYEKRDGTWKFAHRAIVADWAYPADPTHVDMQHPMLEGAHIGEPGEGDPSYGFFRLLRRGQR